jgi:multidrug efflux pump subunit AcrA (membrane-fusion protein)
MMTKTASRRKWFWMLPAVAVAGATLYLIRQSEIRHDIHIVKKGTYEKFIETKGEIQGKYAVNITLSDIFKDPDIQIWDFKIKDMVQEGTIVKKGDWVASLDQVNISQRLQSNQEALEMRLANLNDERVDTALALSQLRQNLRELESELEYKALDLEQSRFESPSYQRRMQTAYNQQLRQIDRMRRNYELQKMNLEKDMKREEERYNYHQRIDAKLREALVATNITAPEAGMVIYARTRWNRKIRIGDEVGPWRPVIATLPDLSVLISETYVEEIDVAKISLNDSATVTVDALPGKRFTGKIRSIANIGQELRGHDSKVFFVTIQLDKNNQKLLPGMTSSNHITIERIADQITIPRKCLFSENGIPFIYLKEEGKIQKKKVKTGQENDEEVVITEGLHEKDRILISPPENTNEINFMTP